MSVFIYSATNENIFTLKNEAVAMTVIIHFKVKVKEITVHMQYALASYSHQLKKLIISLRWYTGHEAMLQLTQ